MGQSERESKICATCGRSFANRRRYGDNWAEVRYCGERCRRNKPAALDRAIEARILTELRARGGTVTPAQIALELFPDRAGEQLERVRQAARRLVADRAIEIIQNGRVVGPSAARGAFLLRLR